MALMPADTYAAFLFLHLLSCDDQGYELSTRMALLLAELPQDRKDAVVKELVDIDAQCTSTVIANGRSQSTASSLIVIMPVIIFTVFNSSASAVEQSVRSCGCGQFVYSGGHLSSRF